MIDKLRDSRAALLLTGATGLIGHHLLALLLGRRRRVVVTLRPPLESSLGRLMRLLGALNVDGREVLARGNLIPVEADLNEPFVIDPSLGIDTILHGAASTRFNQDVRGEPYATNVRGAARLLEWATAHKVRRLHLVSTAYVRGAARGPVAERFHDGPSEFHNDYERSKWQAESLCRNWAARTGAVLTVHRPSIVVGAFDSGRTTKFDGFYLSARATELLSARYDGANDEARHHVRLRLRGRPWERQNIVPVDYVARMIVAALERPHLDGRIFHLVHPDPPTNDQLRRIFDRYFNLAGGRWVDPELFPKDDLNDTERLFYDISRPLEHYFVDTPAFARHEAAALERAADIICPIYGESAVRRLLDYALAARWGKSSPIRSEAADDRAPHPLADYFERFLPAHVARSAIARMTGLSVTIRFIVDDASRAQWVCRFERGTLAQVSRGAAGVREDFGYAAPPHVFEEAIAGRIDPQVVFLDGDAEVFGDVERALKMAMILHAFNKEFPYERPVVHPATEVACANR